MSDQSEMIHAMQDRIAQATPEKIAAMGGMIYEIGLAAAADLFNRGRFQEAAETYVHLTDLDPKRADGFVGLSTCALAQDLPDMAMDTAAMATGLDPDNAAAWFLTGKAQLQLGDTQGAIDDFVIALECAATAGKSALAADIGRIKALAEARLAASGDGNG